MAKKRKSKKEVATGVWTFSLGEGTTELSRMVPTKDGKGRTRRVVGYRHGDLEVEVDFDALKRIGLAALTNKSKKTGIGSGAVTIRAADIRDESNEDKARALNERFSATLLGGDE
jgi:hypothetical protein